MSSCSLSRPRALEWDVEGHTGRNEIAPYGRRALTITYCGLMTLLGETRDGGALPRADTRYRCSTYRVIGHLIAGSTIGLLACPTAACSTAFRLPTRMVLADVASAHSPTCLDTSSSSYSNGDPGAWDQGYTANELSALANAIGLVQVRTGHATGKTTATGIIILGSDAAISREFDTALMALKQDPVLRAKAVEIGQRVREDMDSGEAYEAMMALGSLHEMPSP